MEKKINQLLLTCLIAILMLSSVSLSAQCNYTLQLSDAFGDGWNGSVLRLTINNGIPTNFTLDDISDDGALAVFNVSMNTGDNFQIGYSGGTFEGEVSFILYDSEENLVYEAGPNPPIDTNIFMGTASCPTCPLPLPSSVSVDKVAAVFADLSWASASTGNTIIEFGPANFLPGNGTFINTANRTHTLTGLEENTEYDFYLSMDCGVDTSTVVGPIQFKTVWLNDVGIVGVVQPSTAVCGTGVDSVEILLKNFGQLPQSLIPIQYSVNGVSAGVSAPTDGYYTGVVSFDSITNYSFDATWDFSLPGTYLIEVWTEFEADSNIENDTFTYSYTAVKTFPLIENFEAGVVPADWEVADIEVGTDHNSGSSVIYGNLWSLNPELSIATPTYGLVSAGDEFEFDYRFVDFDNDLATDGTIGTILADDQVEIQVSVDCGETYNTIHTITAANHATSADYANVSLDLSAYEGQSLGFRFFATWAAGDYFLDIDNVNVDACPTNLALNLQVTNPTSDGANDGAAAVNPMQGVPPYTYSWSNLSNQNQITGIGNGIYTVNVTDSIGCVDQITFEIGMGGVATTEIETLELVNIFPNPTNGHATLQVEFTENTDVKVQIIDIYGRIISEKFHSGVLEQSFSLASEQFEAGIYFVRLETEGKWHMEKLLKL